MDAEVAGAKTPGNSEAGAIGSVFFVGVEAGSNHNRTSREEMLIRLRKRFQR